MPIWFSSWAAMRRSAPVRVKWVTEAKAHNKAKLIRRRSPFQTRSASVADYYAPIRPGTDITFLGGLINYLLTNDKIQHDYVVELHRPALPS